MTPAELLARIERDLTELKAALGIGPDKSYRDTPYLTAKEAAAYLNVSYGTFRNWATRIKRSRTGRYRRDDLDHFATTRRK